VIKSKPKPATKTMCHDKVVRNRLDKKECEEVAIDVHVANTTPIKTSGLSPALKYGVCRSFEEEMPVLFVEAGAELSVITGLEEFEG
jgi:hypothetical protein